LCTLAHAVDEADEFLLALGCGADDDQQALRDVLEAGLHVDAVDPEVVEDRANTSRLFDRRA
jgi:hypothetical protein